MESWFLGSFYGNIDFSLCSILSLLFIIVQLKTTLKLKALTEYLRQSRLKLLICRLFCLSIDECKCKVNETLKEKMLLAVAHHQCCYMQDRWQSERKKVSCTVQVHARWHSVSRYHYVKCRICRLSQCRVDMMCRYMQVICRCRYMNIGKVQGRYDSVHCRQITVDSFKDDTNAESSQ